MEVLLINHVQRVTLISTTSINYFRNIRDATVQMKADLFIYQFSDGSIDTQEHNDLFRTCGTDMRKSPKTYPSLQMSYVIHKISMSTAVFCIVDKAFKLTRFGVKVYKVEPNSSDVFD